MAWVYILKGDLNGRNYIGSTSDLSRRLHQHEQQQTPSTKRDYEKYLLVFSQECLTLEEARTLERKIKHLKKKNYIDQIIKDGFLKIKAQPRRP